LTSLHIIAAEISNKDFIRLYTTLNENNDTLISFNEDDYNQYFEVLCVDGIYAMQIIFCLISSIFIAYGIWTLLNIINYKRLKIFPLIIVILGLILCFNIFIIFLLDPFQCRGVYGNLTIYDLILINPLPLNLIIIILISIVWHSLMIKDFSMNEDKWVSNILIAFLISSIILYP